MNPDYFQSYIISLILSWIFFTVTIIGIPFGIIVVFSKRLKKIHLFFLIWIIFCLIIFSPFRYIILQITLAESYSVQSFRAFITSLLLATYIPIIFAVLCGIGLGLPVLGIMAITGFKGSISKTRLYLASIAVPFLFSIGSFLFCLLLPYAAYSIHWLRAEDVIRATNGPSEYTYRYIAHKWMPQKSIIQLSPDLESKLITDKERLRAHVASIYLGVREFRLYIYKTYPEFYNKTNP
jgi:hypothetical protein